MYHLHNQLWLPRAADEVFSFFSDAGNLGTLTPGWLHFQILSKLLEMQVGTLIDYRLRIRGVPLRWTSEITAWEPPFRFVDEQRRGPYRCWIHEHRFQGEGEGIRVVDHVRYDHFGGRLANRLLVAPDLDRIFSFRSRRLTEVFGAPALVGKDSLRVEENPLP